MAQTKQTIFKFCVIKSKNVDISKFFGEFFCFLSANRRYWNKNEINRDLGHLCAYIV